MVNKTLKFVLAKNNLPAAKEPYLGQFVTNGTYHLDAFAEKVCVGRTNIDAPTLKLILETAFKYIAADMAENVFRYQTGLLTFEPAIEGSLPSMDAPLGEANTPYVAVRVSADFLREIGAITPARDTDDAIGVKFDDVLDIEADKRQQVTGTSRFKISGKNISAMGEGEGVEVVGSDGEKIACRVVEEDGMGQRVIAEATAAPAAGKGHVILTTRGYATPDADPITLKKSVTIIAEELSFGITKTVSLTTGLENTITNWVDELNVMGAKFTGAELIYGLAKKSTKELLTQIRWEEGNSYEVLDDRTIRFTLKVNNSPEPDGLWEDPENEPCIIVRKDGEESYFAPIWIHNG